MVLNVLNPFLVAGIFYVRAEEIQPSSEVTEVVENKTEEVKEETPVVEEPEVKNEEVVVEEKVEEPVVTNEKTEVVPEEPKTEETVIEPVVVTEETTDTPEVQPIEEEKDNTQMVEEVKEENTVKCIDENEKVTASTTEMWNTNGNTSETRSDVKLGVKYVFPLDKGVTVTFNCLPENTSKLKIERINISDLDLPESENTSAKYAYDITTDMDNGTFEYDVTLPKPEGQDVKVVYIEKSVEEAKDNIKTSDIKLVDTKDVDQDKSGNSVKATDLDHFTIFYAKFEGEEGPSGSASWTTGDIKGYKEGDTINFRLAIESDAPSTGSIFVAYTSKPSCRFFEYSIPTNVNVSTTGISVTAPTTVTQSGDDAIAEFKLNAASSTSGYLNFTLKLSENATACANGSKQHVGMDHATGDIKEKGAKDLPIPAKAVDPVVDLLISKTGPSTVSIGDTMSYTITVKNTDLYDTAT